MLNKTLIVINYLVFTYNMDGQHIPFISNHLEKLIMARNITKKLVVIQIKNSKSKELYLQENVTSGSFILKVVYQKSLNFILTYEQISSK